ncbi:MULTISPECIES: response regulator [unclassified Rhizobium]|uniref:response regulator n=1 Tax=unclassified Rhizobium TaxID=2613769 RepID=UPI001ADAF2E5|nr:MULTISPECIES: response regulator [unclassified Rhizobium]MBO9100542.1 response regulator [Rhizobium sp. L58/93]MBO9136096.1 response regulator [Rhizobium sp. B209b/85]MBO9171407.1 response regulator [Rhizobium sp. L245/93]MBO9187274.1 response regulator [Rhizobium sp. E27B/91]QXZ87954.1 response regulator [Rhizobium sp. K1/93]
MRILLVEDNFLIGDALHDHIVADGWDVDWVLTLAAARVAADEGSYALVLLDLHLPDGSGLCLLRSLQQTSPHIPVIILSAYDQASDRIEGLENGAIDYLTKPFDLGDALVRIRRFARPQGISPWWPSLKTIAGCGLRTINGVSKKSVSHFD